MKMMLTFILLLAGCDSVQYRGMSPNVRTFADDPRPDQYYVGVDAEFSLADPVDPNQPKKKELELPPPYFPVDPSAIPRPIPPPNIP